MITFGILSWGADKTLNQTLESYEYYKLAKDAEKIVLLQEGTVTQESICRYYGWKPLTLSSNVGIARGYTYLVEEASNPCFMFLENDWRLVEDPQPQISDGTMWLRTGDANIVRYRHRRNPGSPLWTRQFENNEYARATHLLDCVHWREYPEDFPEISKKSVEHVRLKPVTLIDTDKDVIPSAYERFKLDWYFASSKNANWTNNPHLALTSFLKENILPRLGGGNLEGDIQSWWEQQDFRVAQSDGLFTHDRID